MNVISEGTNTLILEADGLEQQKTVWGSTPVSQEQRSEVALGTHSPTLDSWNVWPGLMNLYFCWDAQMVRSEFGVNSMNPWTQPALCQRSSLVGVWWCEEGFLGKKLWAPLHQPGIIWMPKPICCWPCASLYGHSGPSSNGYIQQDKNSTSQSKSRLQWTSVSSTNTRCKSRSTYLWCGRTGDWQHECAADKSALMRWFSHVNMEQNLRVNIYKNILALTKARPDPC